MQEKQKHKPFSWLAVVVTVWMAWNCYQGISESLNWRLVHDSPILHYVASMMFKGYMPYRDMIEINLPLTYWIHMSAIAVFGDGDFAFRLFDLFWAFATAALVAFLCGPRFAVMGVGAGLLYVVLHIAGSAASMGQRDFLMTLFLVASAACALHAGMAAGRRERMLWVLCGVFAGGAAAIKPIAIVLPAFLFTAVYIAEGWKPRQAWRGIIPVCVGLAFPFLLIAAWLVQVGIADAFADVMFNLVATIYTEVRSSDWAEKSGLLLSAGLMISLLTYAGHDGQERSRRHLILQACVWYGVLHYILQRKAFWYNLYPFYAFASAAIACSLEPFINRLRAEGRLIAGIAVLAACGYTSSVGLLSPAGMYGAEWLQPYFKQLDDNMESARAEVLAQFPGLMQQPDAHWRIHFSDFTVAALFAYAYREGWEPVSRFQHPYPYYMAGRSERMSRYREEMLEGFTKSPPHIIIISKQSWPLPDGRVYDVIDGKDGNKDISGFYAQHYKLHYMNGMYRIYTLVNRDAKVKSQKRPKRQSRSKSAP